MLAVIGTRPEAIKLAPVVDALHAQADHVEVRVALTGQHSELVDQVLDVFGFATDWDLGIMREGQDLFDVGIGCLAGLRDVLREYRPSLVVVQGDTGSVFFGALGGFFERAAVGHVEAGLRSGDRWRPYPEEVFRRLTSVLTDAHFAPTLGARDNLIREGIEAATIFVTGNTVVDALLRIAAAPRELRDPTVASAVRGARRLVLVTAHRRESFGAPLREAFGAMRALADRHEDIVLLYPVHPNPNVREPAESVLGGHDRIVLTRPIDYLDLVTALERAALVITDSGGIQEEAPTFGVPVVVLREVTERPEGVAAGVARLVGTDAAAILAAADAALAGEWVVNAGAGNPYGDGRAAERIADIVVHRLTGRPRRTTDWDGGVLANTAVAPPARA